VPENTHATRRGLTLEDLARISVPHEPHISPDGRTVVFTLARMDRAADTYHSNLWIAPADAAREARQLTVGDHKDHAPEFSPDGSRIAFVSNRGGASNVWLIATDGGEAQRLTDVKGEVDEIAWAPNGRALAFTFRPAPAKETNAADAQPGDRAVPTPGEPVTVAPETKEPKKAPRFRHITRLHFKEDGKGFLPAERYHVWLIAVDGLRAGGAPRQLTDGDADDAEPRFSSDGRSVTFVSSRQPDADWYESWCDVFRVSAEGGAIEQLTHNPGPAVAAAPSPDGARLAYCGHLVHQDGGGMTNMHVWDIPAAGGDARDLTPDFDRSAQNVLIGDLKGGWNSRLFYTPDGSRLLFLAGDRGASRVFAIPAAGGKPEALTGDKCDVYDFTTAAGRIAYVKADPQTPGDVWTLDLASGTHTRLTCVNAWMDAEIDLAAVEEFQAPGSGGPVHAWRLRPPAACGIADDARLPAVLHIHGGPHGMYGFTFMHEFQMLAARGFVVVYSNPRGGQGYGQAWASAIKGAWGGVDHDDLMAVADEMARWPYVDAARMGVGGGSYGG